MTQTTAQTTVRPNDNFETGSGFKDEFSMLVDRTRFGTDAEYNSGATILLYLEGVDDDGEEQVVTIPIGGGWSSRDGRTVEHEKNRLKPVATSYYGILINRVLKDAAFAGCLQAMQSAFPGGVDSRVAKIWEGLRFKFQRQEFEFGVDRVTKEKIVRERTMPTAFLPTTTVANTDNGIGAADVGIHVTPQSQITLTSKLKALAKIQARKLDADGFMLWALDQPEITNSEVLTAAALDGALYIAVMTS